jgi:hypothetical protein
MANGEIEDFNRAIRRSSGSDSLDLRELLEASYRTEPRSVRRSIEAEAKRARILRSDELWKIVT